MVLGDIPDVAIKGVSLIVIASPFGNSTIELTSTSIWDGWLNCKPLGVSSYASNPLVASVTTSIPISVSADNAPAGMLSVINPSGLAMVPPFAPIVSTDRVVVLFDFISSLLDSLFDPPQADNVNRIVVSESANEVFFIISIPQREVYARLVKAR